MKINCILSKKFLSFKMVLTYRRTLFYLLKKRGVRAVYNFLYIKSFVMAGGEGTRNWIGRLVIEPFFRLFPQFAVKFVPYPSNIEVEITTRCNKSCIICEHTYWVEPNQDLSFEEFKKIINQFPRLKWVNLTGEGDAFLNQAYLKMIRYLKARDISVFFVDSLDLVNEDVAEELVKTGVDGIWISWDGATRETYEKMKVGCSFDHGVRNIKNIIRIKKKMKSPIPEICFRYIVTTLNMHEMPQFVELVHSFGDRYALGDGSRIEFAGLLVFEKVKHLFVEEIPEDILQATMEKARQLKVHVMFAHSNKSRLPALEQCRAWLEPYIMIGGYVMPCCAVLQSNARDFLREQSFGNILEMPFREIWHSKKYREFREMIPKPKEKVPMLCKGCRAYNTIDRQRKYGVVNI